MNEKNKLFNNARKAYNNIISNLEEMALIIENNLKEHNSKTKYNCIDVLKNFDVLLQYSMLQVGLGDKNLEESEVNFIKDLTKYGDLCEEFKKITGIEITWNKILKTQETFLNKLIKNKKELIEEISNQFITTYALIDAVTEHDYLSDLFTDVKTIILAMCLVDGKPDFDKELKNGCAIMSAVSVIMSKKREMERK